MKKIVLIPCVKSKRSQRSKACDLYTSSLFVKVLGYAKMLNPDAIYILSAKHGVLALDDEIDPYEKTLNNMRTADKREWAKQVLQQLRQRADLEADEFTILAGNNYRAGLVPHIKHCKIPMEGLPIGRQLQWLTERLSE